MKLSICIPHYKETTKWVKELLDSIKIQQNVDFNEIEVIIANDGGDFEQLSTIRRRDYPFKLHIFKMSHAGLSATRNRAMEHATGEFIMFCDADDMFYTVTGLHTLFHAMKVKDFDVLVSTFMEEQRHPETGEPVYIQRPVDYTFVHGKVYRMQYLIDNDIKFDPAVDRNQDSPFNRLAVLLCPQNRLVQNNMPFYVWKYREDSRARKDKKLSRLTGEPNYMDGVESSINQFLDRGKPEIARSVYAAQLFRLYFRLNADIYLDEDNTQYKQLAESRFKQLYDKYNYLFEDISLIEKNNLIQHYKKEAANIFGLVLEKFTFDHWIEHIKNLNE